MTRTLLHPWTLDPDEAIQLQEDLRRNLVLAWDGQIVNFLGGVDVRYINNNARVGIAVLTYPDMAPLDGVTSEVRLTFPYIPGLLAFSIGPAILEAWEKLKLKPDLLLFHGHGIAHPRGVGLASHLGLWLNIPTIGIAKTRLYGIHSEAGSKAGDWSEMLDECDSNHVIGAVLCTRTNAKSVYVSPGHLIDLQYSVKFVFACCRGYRLPEPIRATNKVITDTSRFGRI